MTNAILTSFWPSLAIGAVIGAINFVILSKLVRLFIGTSQEGEAPGRLRIMLLVTLKVALVGAIIILIVQKGYVRPLALLGGFTLALGVAIVCMTLRGSVSSPTR